MALRTTNAARPPADECLSEAVELVHVDRLAITKAWSQRRKKPIDEALCGGVLKAEDLELLRVLRERDLAEVRAFMAPGLTTVALGFTVLGFAISGAAAGAPEINLLLLPILSALMLILGGSQFVYAISQGGLISRQLDRMDERRTRPQPPANPSCSRCESRRRPVWRMKPRISD